MAEAAGSSLVAVLVTDLVASTERRTALGEAAADDLDRAVHAASTARVNERDGTVVKGLGDGLLATFGAAADADAAVTAGHVDAFGPIYLAAEPLAAVGTPSGPLWYGPLARPLGRLAAALGDPEAADTHFAAALAASGRVGSPVWTAHTEVDWAESLLGGDPASAVAHVRLALDLAERNDQVWVARRAREVLAGAGQ